MHNVLHGVVVLELSTCIHMMFGSPEFSTITLQQLDWTNYNVSAKPLAAEVVVYFICYTAVTKAILTTKRSSRYPKCEFDCNSMPKCLIVASRTMKRGKVQCSV